MIISYKHKFIFIHCRKVAGSSIKLYLNSFLGPRDIQIGAWDEVIRSRGRINQRLVLDFFHPKILLSFSAWRTLIKGWTDGKFLKKVNLVHKKRYGWQHPSALEIQRYDPEAWVGSFKFCFVRNPYEKAVSDYIWRVVSRGIDLGFHEFLKRIAYSYGNDKEGVVPTYPDNWTLYTINDRIAVDFVGRYENFGPNFKRVCEIIGVPFDEHKILRMKHFTDYNYRDYYGQKEKELAGRIYRKEIEQFGYSF